MNATTTLSPLPFVRWMIRRDLPEIVAWELDTPGGWDTDRWLEHLRPVRNIAVTAEIGTAVVGCAAYTLEPDGIRIRRISVHPACRRRGVGRALLTRLQTRLCGGSRRTLRCSVRETDLRMQLLLRSLGFVGRLHGGRIRFRWERTD